MDIQSPVSSIKGIGEKTEKLFQNMGVYTAGDILLHFPRDYRKYPEISEMGEVENGMSAAVYVQVRRAPVVKNTRAMQVTILHASSGTGEMEFIWFRMPFLKKTLQPGMNFVFYGKVLTKNQMFCMEQPEIYPVEEYERLKSVLQPVYGLTKGITNKLIQKTVKNILETKDFQMEDFLPETVLQKNELEELSSAVKEIHFPTSEEMLIRARRRLVFDEFFSFILCMQFFKEKGEREKSPFLLEEDSFVEDLMKKLPYDLTGAQKRTLEEIQKDMMSGYIMQRLIQGDVGSGKTIIAYLMMSFCAHNNCQSAIMAPTEVLARQHYESFCEMNTQFGLDTPVILLTGSMTAKEKREAYKQIESLDNAMIIGTHALIQEKVVYRTLALVVTDEQHRFGVKQRETFSGKGEHPHILVMSATPIPRTLAIILYGNLDISVIDEVPARRLPIKNCVVGTDYRKKAYEFIMQEVKAGHQAYIICPLVEASEQSEGENVVDYTLKLKDIFPEQIHIECLHGKMKANQKNKLMEQYLKRQIDVLVSTTVIEVGVNVPNATVMMVENAEKFGLAQLHQLRGRVGRGSSQSYCIFVNGSGNKGKNKRLEILNKSNDGFFIASEDLKLRGPGDFIGIRQSGILEFKIADIIQDASVLKSASDTCEAILAEDPELKEPENQGIKRKLDSDISKQMKMINL